MAEQGKRIQFLQDALSKLARSIKEVSKGLIDLEGSIARITGKTKEFTKAQQEAAQQVNRVGKNLKDTAKTVDDYEKKTKKAATTSKGFFGNIGKNLKTIASFYGAYQLLNIALSAFSDITIGSAKRAIALEKSLADLRAVAGLTSEDISRLKTVVFEVAGVTSLTATEVVELQKQLAKLGSSTEEIENLTRPIALLSQALGEDAGGVAGVLKKTLNQFQATSEEADKFANILTGAVNETALSLNDLGTGLSYVGPLGAQLGVSFEETASLLGILADNGFKASKAGTGLRNFFVAAAKDGRPFNEFLEEIGNRNLTAAESFEVFGKIGASQALVLSQNVDRFKELSSELQTSDRLFKANATQMASTEGQLQLLTSAYDKFSTTLGEVATKSDLFLSAIAIFDQKAAGQASAYKLISSSALETQDAIEALTVSQRRFSEGSDELVSETDLIIQAFDALGDSVGVSKEFFLKKYNQALEKTGNATDALKVLTKTLNAELTESALTIQGLIDITNERSNSLDKSYIAQEANNETVSRYSAEYAGLLSLTREGINVDKEKQQLQTQLNADTLEYSNQLNQLRNKVGPLNQEEEEQARILEKRIALLTDASKKIGKLSVSEETLASQRKKADKEAEDRLKTDLSSYIARIKETEKAIAELPLGVSDKVFSQQVDLLDGFFGSSEDVIAEATKRFGADSPFVKGLVQTLKKAAEEVAVQIPEDPFADVILDPSALEGFEEDYVDGVTKAVKTIGQKLKDSFKDVKLAEVIAEGLDKAAESIAAFNDVALENTKARLDAEKSAISNRYETENDILKSQLDNQLITESQFRAKQNELQKAKIAQENDIDKKVFEADKKQDRQDATTSYLQSLASIIPNLIIYDKEGNPVKLAIKGAISAGLTTAAYGANLAAISQKKFFPKKFADGGVVNGPSHEQGGVPFRVQGNSGYEMEGGEYIINKRATSMHKDLLDRINKSGMTRPQVGRVKFAEGGLVSSPLNESVDYLKAIAEATTSTAIGVSKPVRAFVADKDLRTNSNERRLRDRNDRI